MENPVVELQSISKRFGGFTALSDVSFSVRKGERIGLIGPNGAGKSTLVDCICGTIRQDAGKISYRGQDIAGFPTHRRAHLGLVRSFQIPRPFASMTVLENLYIPLTFIGRKRGHDERKIHAKAVAILHQFRLAAKADFPSNSLTQVDLRKLELARGFAAQPTLFIADEALAGLSSSEVDEVLDLLLQFSSEEITIIMIEHIMRAVMGFSQRVLCLNAGRMIADGSPHDVINSAEVRRAYFGT